jgi:NAD+ diphosphatase
VWNDGAPVLDEQGKLRWQPAAAEPVLFLGFQGEAPRFSHLPDGNAPANAYALIHLLALLDEREAPTFAAALSLANWHRRHLHCSVCGQSTEPTAAAGRASA